MYRDNTLCYHCAEVWKDHGQIDTLEGRGFTVCPSDWIIKGVKEECYPCKNDIFIETYDSLDEI